MKTNIERIDYGGSLNPKGKWWRWQEFCVLCGANCGKDSWQTMTEPNTKEKDFCLDCLRKFKGKIKEKIL